MANQDDIALMAHLMRRAGFGASRDELEARVAKGYDATVEELLNPETQPPVDPYTLLRHQPAALLPGGQPPMGNVNYMYYLVNTKRPLEEKMALFWHHRVRHRQLEGRQLRSAAGADRAVPRERHGQLSRPAAEDREEPDDDLLARQQPEPRHRGQRELGPRTARTVQPRRRQLHRDGRPRGSRAFTGWTFETKTPARCPTAGSRGSSSIARKTTTTARRRSSATRATSTARTSSTSSCSSRPAPSSSAGICTTSSSPTSRRCRPGRSKRRAIQQAIDDAGGGVPRFEVRHEPVLRVHVQLGLLQERALPAPEVAGRGGRRHAAPGRRLRAAEARLWRAVDAAVLHGPGPAQPAVGRGLAHRQGVDQQRLADGAHQLRRGTDRQYLDLPGVRDDHRPAEGAGHAEPRAARRRTASICSARSRSAPTPRRSWSTQAKQWGEIGWDNDASTQNATQRAAEMLQLIVATREYQFG